MKTSTLINCTLVVAVISAAGCRNAEQGTSDSVEAREVVFAAEDDIEMGMAMQKAAASLDDFRKAVRAPPKGASRFEVKARFRSGSVVEHMWLTSVRETAEGFTGELINEPYRLVGYRSGQQLTVAASAVSDWAYVEDGVLVGGFTLRVMFARTPPEQRELLQRRLGYRIEAAQAASIPGG